MSYISDFEHWRIKATVFKDRVEEQHIISDPARSIRREEKVKTWRIRRIIGRGGFGDVRLEDNTEDNEKRAVKRIRVSSAELSDYERELKALLEFTKPKVSWNL
jgi:serine/threonine protein kinase